MRWHEVTVHTTEEAIEMITNFIHELGAGGVSIEESGTLNKERDTSLGQWYELPLNDIPEGRAVIKGYFTEGSDMEAIAGQLDISIRGLDELGIDTGIPEISLQDVDDEDWATAWKQYFKPLRISERLTIKPTWEDYEASPDELIIELDPGMAFGTGTHATTALCLRTLETVVRPGDEVIDVGTGSGVLSIAAVKLGARHVLALDLDPVAVSSAQENARLNGLEDRITVQQSDLLQALNRADGAYEATGETRRAGSISSGNPAASAGSTEKQAGGSNTKQAQAGGTDAEGAQAGVQLPVRVVVANILAEILLLFVDDVYRALLPDGVYIASGIIKAKEADVAQALEASGFRILNRYEDQDWVALVAGKQ